MSELIIEEGGNYLELADKIDDARMLEIAMEDMTGGIRMELTEEDAVQLVCHLIAVFHIESNIEVIAFPIGADKAECLRNAADRLDGAIPEDITVSCPLDS